MKTLSKSPEWAAPAGSLPLSALVLHLAAAALRAASELLDRVAARATADRRPQVLSPTVLEFHAIHRDAGAPEGTLYVDGKFVGTLDGVTRL